MNEAQQVLSVIGAPHNSEPYVRYPNGAKNFSWTKKGPGRIHQIKTKLELAEEAREKQQS